MPNRHFLESAKACIANGEHLLEDAEFLEFAKHPSTMFALSVIAQEEFAKGLLLVLADKGVLPWNPLIYRAARDHHCKQLLGIVMEHMNPEGDLFFTRIDDSLKLTNESSQLLKLLDKTESKEERDRIWRRINEINEWKAGLPATVADAINILRHEKIGRWQSAFDCVKDPQYDLLAKMTAEGSLDREKQGALYVGISRTGEFVSSPLSTDAEKAKVAFDRANRLGQAVKQLIEGNTEGLLDYEKIESAFKGLFAENETTLIVRKQEQK